MNILWYGYRVGYQRESYEKLCDGRWGTLGLTADCALIKWKALEYDNILASERFKS